MIRSKVLRIVDLLQSGHYHQTIAPDGIVYDFFTPKGTEFKLKDNGIEWQAYDPFTKKFEDCFTIQEVQALAKAVEHNTFTNDQNNAFDRIEI